MKIWKHCTTMIIIASFVVIGFIVASCKTEDELSGGNKNNPSGNGGEDSYKIPGLIFGNSSGNNDDDDGSSYTVWQDPINPPSGAVVIPATYNGKPITGIGSFTLNTGITSITIPDSVTTITGDAFRGCTGLTNITIPDSVKYIYNYAFCYCDNLSSVTIGSGVTIIGQAAFYQCDITSITIPANVTTIGQYAFGYCSDLTSVTFAVGSNMTTSSFAYEDFSFYVFPEGSNGTGGNSLRTAYANASTKAGLYTRDTGGSTWTKQW